MRASERRPRADRIAHGTFASVIRAYMISSDFRGLADATREGYARALHRAEAPEMLGAVGVNLIRPAIIQAYLDGLADLPGKASHAKTALGAVERWALVRDLVPWPYMTGTRAARSEGGHEPWTDEQVAIAERHARPDLAHIITLGANTGQRGSDLVRMRWADLEEHTGRLGINVVQRKTGLRLWLPLTQQLETALSTWERRPGFIALQANGLPFSRPRLSIYWGEERDSNQALAPLREAGCVIHGLRATAVVRLRRAGANVPQIADMVGMSEPMVARYCRFANQRDNALAAVHYLDQVRPMADRKKGEGNGG